MIRTLVLLAAVIVGLACATTVSEKDRAAARLRYGIGVSAFQQGDQRTALQELLAAVATFPDYAEAHNALGLVYHAMGRRVEALRHYDRAVELLPGFSEAHNNRGVLLLDLGRYDDAVIAFERALADILYPTPFFAEAHLGWAYYKKGAVERGLKHLRNAVATSPTFCRGYAWLAEISLATGQADQALAYCKRFIKHCLENEAIAPGVPPAFRRQMSLLLGQAHLALGQKPEARAALEGCAGDEGGDTEVAAKCAQLRSTLD